MLKASRLLVPDVQAKRGICHKYPLMAFLQTFADHMVEEHCCADMLDFRRSSCPMEFLSDIPLALIPFSILLRFRFVIRRGRFGVRARRRDIVLEPWRGIRSWDNALHTIFVELILRPYTLP